VPVTFTEVVELTPNVVTGNVALLCPTGIITEAGTVTAVFADIRLTVVPPAGACPTMVTVPVLGVPPITGDGLIDRLDRVTAGRMVSVADWLTLLQVAVIVAVVVVATLLANMVKVDEFVPW